MQSDYNFTSMAPETSASNVVFYRTPRFSPQFLTVSYTGPIRDHTSSCGVVVTNLAFQAERSAGSILGRTQGLKKIEENVLPGLH